MDISARLKEQPVPGRTALRLLQTRVIELESGESRSSAAEAVLTLQPEDHLHATDAVYRDPGTKHQSVLPGDRLLKSKQPHFCVLSSPTQTVKYEATSVETQNYCLIKWKS